MEAAELIKQVFTRPVIELIIYFVIATILAIGFARMGK